MDIGSPSDLRASAGILIPAELFKGMLARSAYGTNQCCVTCITVKR